MIDTAKYKSALLKKQTELDEEISSLETQGREARTSEVEDSIDEVTSDEAQAVAFQTGTALSDIHEAVEAALQRIEDGSYGICIDCDRAIEEARLNAVPWSPYCLEDQEKHDREKAGGSEYDQLESSL